MPELLTRNAYRFGLLGAAATSLALWFLAGAVGIVGVEGDPADAMYLAVLLFAVVASAVARLRPAAMATAMTLTAGTFMVTALVALGLGRHEAAYSSIAELLGLNAMFATGYLAAAWCFRTAADRGTG